MIIQARLAEGPWKELSEDDLATFCLHKCGGGYNVEQTIKAMEMQRSILAGDVWHGGATRLEIRAIEETP